MNTIKQQVGQAFCPAAFIHDTSEGTTQIERYIRDYEVGGLTFFYSRQSVETNFDRKTYVREKDSVAQLARMIDHYQQISRNPLLISIDAEWGLGMRIDTHPAFPYPLTLAASGSPDLVFEVGRAIALELKAVGVHFNLAPVVDINVNPENPVIGYRSFGVDPIKVFELARAYYEGMKAEGILGCVKHFPGHGDTQVDSHLGLPLIEKEKDELHRMELSPFKSFLKKSVDCVMVGHLQVPSLDPEHPTSLSTKVIDGFLRQEMGFGGAVMTDALNMRSVFTDAEPGDIPLRAFQAGNDILSFTPDLEEGFDQIVKHADPVKIETSYQRVLALKDKAGLDKGINRPKSEMPQSLKIRSQMAPEIITVLKPIIQTISTNDEVIAWFQEPGEAFEEFENLTIKGKQDMVSTKYEVSRWVLVTPPSQKPGNQFGMDDDLLVKLNDLVSNNKIHLAWFGNPYSLKFCNWQQCESVVLAYQNLPEFQAAVVEYWKGGPTPKGKTPIKLDQ